MEVPGMEDGVEVKKGTVYWVTGLAGAGKTTIGGMLYHWLRRKSDAVVFLDGDRMRDVFGANQEYDLKQRNMLAMQYARLCKMLCDQGITVVCATISMFHDVRKWNRENIGFYREIYLKVPLSVLAERDQKGLYSRLMRGEAANVMGVDIEFEEPVSPDLTIHNDGKESPGEILGRILSAFHLA